VLGDCEALSSVHSSSCPSLPTVNFAESLALFRLGPLPRACVFRKGVVGLPGFPNCVCDEPLRFRAGFDEFRFIDVFDPTRGNETLELFRRTSWAEGLVEGVCCFARISVPFSSVPCIFVSLFKFRPYDGFRACAIRPAVCALC